MGERGVCVHTLNYELKHLGLRNRDGSFVTQANRAYMLSLMANQLYELGYKKLHAHELKGRHVNALVRRWQAEGLAPGTVKNRLSVVRWWAEKVGRATVLADDNTAYGVPARRTVATSLESPRAGGRQAGGDPRSLCADEPGAAACLWPEEGGVLKVKPRQADHGDRLVLQGSWTKGGRPREVPIRTAAQREVLDRAKALARAGAMIPPTRRYVEQRRVYERETARVGLSKMHGLRHAYAQERFAELAGFAAPAAGGPTRALLTPEQRGIDSDVRLIITEELGHAREEITRMYLGR